MKAYQRLLSYVKISTPSNEESASSPSSQCQFDLARLLVEELKDLAEAGAPAMPIGKEAAAYAAEQYAGTTALDSVTTEIDSELDESPAHYEVELEDRSGTEYEYRIDAYTGAVLTSYVEPDGHDDVDDHDDHDDDHDDDDDDVVYSSDTENEVVVGSTDEVLDAGQVGE